MGIIIWEIVFIVTKQQITVLLRWKAHRHRPNRSLHYLR